MMCCKVIIMFDLCIQLATVESELVPDNVGHRKAHSSVCTLLNKHHVTLPHFLSPLRVGIF